MDVSNSAARNQITREALDTIPTNKTLEAFAALTPGVTMATGIGQDVGGSKGETYVQLRIHGTRTGDNKTLVDGFETNEYSGRVFVPNPAAASEVSIELGNGPGEAPANGVYVNFVPRDGGNMFHGSAFGTYTGPGFQSEPKLTDDLISRGLAQRDLGKVLRIWDANGSLGGPIVRDKLWFHTATRSWGSANSVVDAYFNLTPTAWTYARDLSRPANDDFNNIVVSNRFTYQATDKHKFNVSYDWENRCDCHRSVSATLAPEASARREYYPKVLALTWNFPATNRLLFSTGTASNWMGTARSRSRRRRSTPSAWSSSPQAFDTGRSASIRLRPAPATARNTTSFRTRDSPPRTSPALTTSRRASSCGRATRSTSAKASPIEYAFRNELPVQLTMVAYPLTYVANMRAQMGLYAQDQWTLNRLTLNLGLRYDYQNSFIPEQHLPAGPFIGERNFGEVDCVPCWKDWSPRGSAIFDLFGNGKTAIKVSTGRYVTENMLGDGRRQQPAGGIQPVHQPPVDRHQPRLRP